MAIIDNLLFRAGTTDAADREFSNSLSGRLNRLRAGVLGANDGIVSTAAIILGVAGATSTRTSILIAGVVGLLAGAMSMAVGEYVSVSTQRDTERSVIARQRRRMAEDPAGEQAALAAVYREKGLDHELASRVADELTRNDGLRAHAETRLGVDPNEFTQPGHAALASFLAFVIGAAIPLAGVVIAPTAWLTVAAVAIALALTGAVSARLGRAPVGPAVLRNVAGGLVAMGVTFGLGTLIGGLF